CAQFIRCSAATKQLISDHRATLCVSCCDPLLSLLVISFLRFLPFLSTMGLISEFRVEFDEMIQSMHRQLDEMIQSMHRQLDDNAEAMFQMFLAKLNVAIPRRARQPQTEPGSRLSNISNAAMFQPDHVPEPSQPDQFSSSSDSETPRANS